MRVAHKVYQYMQFVVAHELCYGLVGYAVDLSKRMHTLHKLRAVGAIVEVVRRILRIAKDQCSVAGMCGQQDGQLAAHWVIPEIR
jgi:hypothetical protein